MGLEYKELTAEDQLVAAKGRLRGIETDHYNLTLTDEQPDRRADLEAQHASISSVIEKLEKEIAKAKPKEDPA